MRWSKYWDWSLQVDVFVLAISLLEHIVTHRQSSWRRLFLGTLKLSVVRRMVNLYPRGHNYCCNQYIFLIMTWSKYWDHWLKRDVFYLPVAPLAHVIIRRQSIWLSWNLLTPLDTTWQLLRQNRKNYFCTVIFHTLAYYRELNQLNTVHLCKKHFADFH